jgi:hypothetical protein
MDERQERAKVRDRIADERDDAADKRDRISNERDDAADQRDRISSERDRAADERDEVDTRTEREVERANAQLAGAAFLGSRTATLRRRQNHRLRRRPGSSLASARAATAPHQNAATGSCLPIGFARGGISPERPGAR